MSAARIAVGGDIADDHYIDLPEQAPADEKTTALGSRHLLGGTGANAAAAAARLGSAVSLHASVGDDPVADWLRAQIHSVGVDCAGIRTVPGASTQALILLKGGHRQVIVERGVADRLEHLHADALADADLVYTSCGAPTLRRLVAEGLGPRLIAGIEAWMVTNELLATLSAVRCVVTNRAGFETLDRPPYRCTIETRSDEGVIVHRKDGSSIAVPAFAIDAVDATGAGDALAGALCHYLASGASLSAAVERAVIAAALSTRAFGAQGALPTEAELNDLLSSPRAEEPVP